MSYQKNTLIQFFKEENGNVDFNLDLSAGTTKASIISPPGVLTSITGMRVSLSDSGSLDAGSYGNGITLVNGINLILETLDNQLLVDFSSLGPGRVFSTGDWNKWFFDVKITDFGSGHNYSASTSNLVFYQTAFQLLPGTKLSWVLEDDFSALEAHNFVGVGFTVSDNYRNRKLWNSEY